jgi:hypothetical protein
VDMSPPNVPHTEASENWGTVPMPPAPDQAGDTTADLGAYNLSGQVEAVPPRRRSRRTTVMVAVATAVLLVGGVGAFAAVRMLAGSGSTEPESAMPASVTTFARVDANPGGSDQVLLDNLVKKFSPGGQTAQDLLTAMEQRAATQAGLNYATDVKPWFDGRFGVGAWTDSAGHRVSLLTLASKDDSAARTALGKIQASKGQAHFGYTVNHGYALVTSSQTDADAATAQAHRGSLANARNFRSALDDFSGNNLVVAYADMHSLAAGLSARLNNLGGFGNLSGGGSGPGGEGLRGLLGMLGSGGSSALRNVKGTVVVGVSVTDNGLEIRAHGTDTHAARSTAGADARPTLDAMPNGTIAGLAVDGLDPNGAAAKSLSKAISNLLSSRLAQGSNGNGIPPAFAPVIAQVATKLLTVKVIGIGFAGVSNGKPAIQASLKAQTNADASSILTLAAQFLAPRMPGLVVSQDGDTVHAVYGPAGSGKLSDSALYQQAMAGVDKANSTGYLDVQAALALMTRNGGQIPPRLAHIKAIAFAGTESGTSSDGLVRVIVS